MFDCLLYGWLYNKFLKLSGIEWHKMHRMSRVVPSHLDDVRSEMSEDMDGNLMALDMARRNDYKTIGVC